MSKTAIVKTGEQFFIKQLSKSQAIKLDKVIFANINGINGDTEIDLNGSMPDASQIVHTAPVTQSGLLNDKTVVYSVILDTSIGDFSFNYIGLVNAETNTLCMVMHTDLTRKIKTAGQRQGNTITESIWLEIDNASESTGIAVNAQTWQIDYSKRLSGEDERIRLTNYDLYNRLAIHNGFTITKNNNQLAVSAGLAYVAGLRVEHAAQKSVKVENNQSLYIDAWLAGTVTGEWSVNYNLIACTDLRDYEKNGFKHYVERVASVDASGKLVVVKPKSFITTYDHATTEKVGIVKLSSAIDSNSETTAATSKAIKIAYDLAHEKLSLSGGKITGDLVIDKQNAGIKLSTNDTNYMLSTNAEGDAFSFYFPDVNNNYTQRLIYTKENKTFDFKSCEVKVNSSSVITGENINQYIPVGIPMPWPQSTPPVGWLECNGATFDKNKFTKLAQAYTNGRLPDLRSEFIRGWDNGKGIDSNREILSYQSDELKSHNHKQVIKYYGEQGSGNPWASGDWGKYEGSYNYTTGNAGGNETRPRNVAFMYIVKAE